MNNKKQKCDLSDVLELLRLSRILIRQLNILSGMTITKKYLEIIDEAVQKVKNAADRYIQKEGKCSK